jgi:hypothetical protein
MEPNSLVVKWPDAPAQIYRSEMIIYMMLLHSIRTPGAILKGI